MKIKTIYESNVKAETVKLANETHITLQRTEEM